MVAGRHASRGHSLLSNTREFCFLVSVGRPDRSQDILRVPPRFTLVVLVPSPGCGSIRKVGHLKCVSHPPGTLAWTHSVGALIWYPLQGLSLRCRDCAFLFHGGSSSLALPPESILPPDSGLAPFPAFFSGKWGRW